MSDEPVIHFSLHQAKIIAEDAATAKKAIEKLLKHLEFGILEGFLEKEEK